MAFSTMQDRQKKANKAAVQTAKDFTGKIANTLAYPGQVVHGTFNQLAKGVQNLPQTMRDYDANYGKRVRSNLEKLNQKGRSPLPTPMNQQIVSPQKKSLPLPDMRSDPVSPVDVVNNNYAQKNGAAPQLFNRNDVANLQVEKANNAETTGTGSSLPMPVETVRANEAQFNEGPHLPGQGQTSFDNDYLQRNQYVTKGNPDRMAQRQAEAQAVQQRRLDFINKSEAGVFDVGGAGPTFSKFDGHLRNKFPEKLAFDDFNPKSARGRATKQQLVQNENQANQNFNLAQQKTKQNFALGQDKLLADNRKTEILNRSQQSKAQNESAQQQFNNQLAVNKHKLDMEKFGLDFKNAQRPNVDTYYDEVLGRQVFYDKNKMPDNQGANNPLANYNQEQVNRLLQSRQLAQSNPKAMKDYQAVLKNLGIDDQYLEMLQAQQSPQG